MRAWATAIALLFALPVRAEQAPADWPLIAAIEFTGNEATRESVLRREMIVTEGDPADPKKIERSRQYIQDLGLFRKVSVGQRDTAAGVILTFKLEERWYFLPYPRYGVNVEGQSSVGFDLRWANVAGLNHNLNFRVLRNERKQEDRGVEKGYSFGYSVPYIFDSPYRLGLSFGHSATPVSDPVDHEETVDSASFSVSRTFRDPDGARSQGTSVSLGLAWQQQHREGEGVPEPLGMATALTASYGYRNLRSHIFSDEGVSWRLGGTFAREGLASDYSYQFLEAGYTRHLPLGGIKHQTLSYHLGAGFYSNGPEEITAYSFGGSSTLRGFPVNSQRGNAYYLGTVEYFRPIFDPGLRIGAILEVGRVHEGVRDIHLADLDASLGFALRWRLVNFVALEVELGWAFPLNGGEGKLFGGRV